MKIQINGFDIEIENEETNMTVKVLDASGKELSNNTYSQSTDDTGGPAPVDMPTAEETAEGDTPEDTETPEGDTNETPEGEENTDVTEEEPAEITEEGFMPSFEQFKKLMEAKKKKEEESKKKKAKPVSPFKKK
jgi:hypothetical protein